MRTLYISSSSIATFSKNSNAYQQPYNLCKNTECTLLVKKSNLINDEIKATAKNIHYSDIDLKQLITNSGKIKDLYNTELSGDRFDAIISDFSEWSVFLGRRIAKLSNLPWFVILWDPPFYNRYEINKGLRYTVERSIRLSLYNSAVANSAGCLCFINEGIIEAEGLKFKEAYQLFNGVDISVTDNILKTVEQKKRHAICNIGRVRIDKGGREILESFKSIAAEIPDATLTFVGQVDGGDAEKAQIQKIIDEHPNGDRIRVTGRIPFEEAMKIVAGCQIGIHAYSSAKYLYYNHLLKVGEYQALGVVPVSVKYPGTLDLIKDGETGIFINSNQSTDISKAVIDLFNNEDLLKKISAKAAEEVRKRSWEIVTKNMLKIIDGKVNHK